MNPYLSQHAVNAAIDASQVMNNAGGFVYQLSDFDRFKRFLFLGSNSNTYYASQQVAFPTQRLMPPFRGRRPGCYAVLECTAIPGIDVVFLIHVHK